MLSIPKKKTMIKKSSILRLSFLFILLLVIHFLILQVSSFKSNLYFLLSFHLYLYSITLLVILFFLNINKNKLEKFGSYYVLSVVLKMAITIGFLSIFIFHFKVNKFMILQFFTLFFIYLFYEVVVLKNHLKRPNF